MLINKESIIEAARKLIKNCILDEIEDADAHASLREEFDNADDLVDHIMEHQLDDVMFQMGLMMGAVNQAWGYEIGLVFHHAGFLTRSDEYVGKLLYRLFMGCFGTGVSLVDDQQEDDGLKKSAEILLTLKEKKKFDPSPVRFEQCEMTNVLVEKHLLYNQESEEHEHQWGELEQSRMAGTWHRKCQVDGCNEINALDDDESDEEDCEHTNAVLSDANEPATYHCPDCGENFIGNYDEEE